MRSFFSPHTVAGMGRRAAAAAAAAAACGSAPAPPALLLLPPSPALSLQRPRGAHRARTRRCCRPGVGDRIAWCHSAAHGAAHGPQLHASGEAASADAHGPQAHGSAQVANAAASAHAHVDVETDAADGDSPGLGPGSEALAGAVWRKKQSMLPGLYLVPTPIGNLQASPGVLPECLPARLRTYVPA
eukprot:357233-Chlamydomonas_euryale.AAC.4